MRNEVGQYGTVYQPENGIDGRSSSGFPGTFIVDGVLTPDAACPDENIVNNVCRYDYGPQGAVLPEAERAGIMVMANQKFNDYAEGYFEFSGQHNTSRAYGAATPLGRTAGLTVNADHPDNPYGQDIIINNYRTVDAGPRIWNIESDTFRLVAGIRGNINNWDYDLSAQKGRSKSLQTGGIGDGWIRVDYLQREIDAGNYNPFGGTYNDPDVVADISTSLVRQGESHMTSFNFNVAGDAFTVSDMVVQVAAGLEYREEDVADFGGLVHRHNSVTVHHGLERPYRVYLTHYGVCAHALGPVRKTATTPAVADGHDSLAGQQDVGRPDDSVQRALSRPVPVIEEVLGLGFIYRDYRVA